MSNLRRRRTIPVTAGGCQVSDSGQQGEQGEQGEQGGQGGKGSKGSKGGKGARGAKEIAPCIYANIMCM